MKGEHSKTLALYSGSVSLCLIIHSSILLPPTSCCLYLFHCRTDRKIHDKNGEITLLQDRIAELEEDVEQERREVVNLREGLRLRQESLDVQQQQQQRQRVRREGMGVGWKVIRGGWGGGWNVGRRVLCRFTKQQGLLQCMSLSDGSRNCSCIACESVCQCRWECTARCSVSLAGPAVPGALPATSAQCSLRAALCPTPYSLSSSGLSPQPRTRPHSSSTICSTSSCTCTSPSTCGFTGHTHTHLLHFTCTIINVPHPPPPPPMTCRDPTKASAPSAT